MKLLDTILAGSLSLLICAPLCAQDTTDCFLRDFEEKFAEIPPYEQTQKPTAASTVTVTFNGADTVGKVSKYIYGNNANPYMSQMVDQPALINYITMLSPNIIRYPGGNLSSVYFWDAASGIPAGAPDSIVDGATGKKINPGYWYGKSSWSQRLDNYYTMLDMTGSTGIITINYGFARYGTSQDPVAAAAHYAANWVRYDGGRTKFWEIGNESYGNWQAGYMIDVSKNKDGQPAVQTGALYGQHFKVFADSMRKAAETTGNPIAIGAQLYEVPGGYTTTLSTWNSGYFSQAGNAADFYIVHSYFTPYGQNSNAATVLNSGQSTTTSIMSFIKTVTTQNSVSMKPLALTEWNIFAQGSKQACSFVNGMLASIVLGELAKNGFSMSSRWDLANGYDNGNDHGMFSQGDEPGGVPKWNPRPVFFYMYYFQKCFGDQIVSASVAGSANILAYASRFSSGHAGVVVVNKGTTDQVISLNPANYGFGDQYYIYSLTGGTDNGEFSQSVSVNDQGPTNANGGPIGTLSDIPARAYAANGGILFESPARSVQYVLLEPGNNVGIKNQTAGRIADRFILNQNYPNPFNPQTVISYSLPRASTVTLKVFDVMGREVATLLQNERVTAGSHQTVFNAANMPSGIYFCTLQADAYKATKKMVVVK